MNVLFCLSFTYAGGSYQKGKISDFSTNIFATTFTFEEENNNTISIISSCKKFKVKLIYSHVPWYSWLPFVKSSHPTYEENNKAIQFIENAYKNKKTINFGYMGDGLIQIDKKCIFKSRGLYLNNDTVLSLYNPV